VGPSVIPINFCARTMLTSRTKFRGRTGSHVINPGEVFQSHTWRTDERTAGYWAGQIPARYLYVNCFIISPFTHSPGCREFQAPPIRSEIAIARIFSISSGEVALATFYHVSRRPASP